MCGVITSSLDVTVEALVLYTAYEYKGLYDAVTSRALESQGHTCHALPVPRKDSLPDNL